MMKICIHMDRNGIDAPSDSEFQNWVATALQGSHTHADIPNSPELSIQLVTGEEMSRLNMQYRGKSQDTNVLSFPVEPSLQAQTGYWATESSVRQWFRGRLLSKRSLTLTIGHT